ncbi:MAG: carbon-nitrogen hydrolase family protein, partial [Atribacterota bacterium]
MDKITVSCVQFKPELGKTSQNLDKIASFFQQIKGSACHVIVFPELCVQGVASPETIDSTAEPIPGNASHVLCELSKTYGVYSVAGIAEREGSKLYNSAILINPDGKINGIYHKVHLWDTEATYFSHGSHYPVFDTEFGKVAMWICYDTRFPEVARSYALKGARIAFVPTAWFARDVSHWQLLIRVRALDNFMYVCGADEIVQSELFQASGYSMILDPCGKIIAAAEPMRETIINGELDLSKADSMRTLIPVLRDRQKQT